MDKFLRWENLSWPALKELAEQNAIVLLPVGATEEHGPHMPTGTDTFLSTTVANMVADVMQKIGKKAIVAPSINVGVSTNLMNFAGTMTLKPSTLMLVLKDYCESIASHGFRRIFIINGHGGNTAPIRLALGDINKMLGFNVFSMDYYRYPGYNERHAGIYETQPGMVHGCEGETSMVMAYDEELVLLNHKELKAPEVEIFWAEAAGIISTFRGIEHTAPQGYLGNPCAATKEKGERLFNKDAEIIVSIISDERLWEDNA